MGKNKYESTKPPAVPVVIAYSDIITKNQKANVCKKAENMFTHLVNADGCNNRKASLSQMKDRVSALRRG